MVVGLLHRLGMVGAILIVSALIFGAVAGGVVVHRLQATPSASSEDQHRGEAVEKTPAAAEKNKDENHESNQQGDHQDKDT